MTFALFLAKLRKMRFCNKTRLNIWLALHYQYLKCEERFASSQDYSEELQFIKVH